MCVDVYMMNSGNDNRLLLGFQICDINHRKISLFILLIYKSDCMFVCLSVCMCAYSSETAELICMKLPWIVGYDIDFRMVLVSS